MSRRRRSRPDPTVLAADLGPEDGSDPKEFHRKPWDAPKAAGRKALQLCGQVKDALHSVLAACGDEVLRDLAVVGVEPAPHSGRLRVRVAVPGDGDLTRADAEGHLRRAAGMLRAAVAAAISRRHAPELVFEVTG
ncbi:MAG: ribosome-binding factor [Gemmataceae bacterium]|nr:ribosome-binding factor [Gemmataceae bacterium]